MRGAGSIVGSLAVLVVASALAAGRAEAQAVGFQPNVGLIPDGVNLSATPAVSADRRYVRLSLNANFSTINGFSNFPVAGAVGGGGGGGGGGLGGLLGGPGGGAGGGGFRSVIGGPDGFADLGIPYRPEYMAARKPARSGPARSKKPLPDPVMIPIEKGEAGARPVPAPPADGRPDFGEGPAWPSAASTRA